jgi:hypothetical protein
MARPVRQKDHNVLKIVTKSWENSTKIPSRQQSNSKTQNSTGSGQSMEHSDSNSQNVYCAEALHLFRLLPAEFASRSIVNPVTHFQTSKPICKEGCSVNGAGLNLFCDLWGEELGELLGLDLGAEGIKSCRCRDQWKEGCSENGTGFELFCDIWGQELGDLLGLDLEATELQPYRCCGQKGLKGTGEEERVGREEEQSGGGRKRRRVGKSPH